MPDSLDYADLDSYIIEFDRAVNGICRWMDEHRLMLPTQRVMIGAALHRLASAGMPHETNGD